MEQLKTYIQRILSEKSTIDWLIVHTVSKHGNIIDGLEFSFVDEQERLDEPFKTCQGYISLKRDDAIKKFNELIVELSDYFKENLITLANLFIIATRTCYKGEDKKTILKNFKQKTGQSLCNKIFAKLIDSLNSDYYKDNHFNKNQFKSTDEWIEIFRSAQYAHSISDPLVESLFLVQDKQGYNLNYNLLKNMKPFMRAVLIEQYGFILEISNRGLRAIYENQYELSFLSAYLINIHSSEVPNWLSQELVEKFITKHWGSIGKQVFVHVFGLSYRNKNQNEVIESLGNLIHEVLYDRLSKDSEESKKLINTFEFPKDFIALFYWFDLKHVDTNSITEINKTTILGRFIQELQRINNELPTFFASEHSSDPWVSFQFGEQKYQITFAYLLWFLLYATCEDNKQLKKIFYKIKPLFYGGFRACRLATQFTELMLLIGLSAIHLNDIDKNGWSSIKKYLAIIEETVLIPYIHIAERNSEIWDINNKIEMPQYQAGLYLVNDFLYRIRNSEINEHYKDFIATIDDIKIAKWKYDNVLY
ncbi:MAG: hypothetical protein LBP67_01985 [Bacteroidales bacterium]|nr:hypothetical protein [Bacteroidales bacterium]